MQFVITVFKNNLNPLRVSVMLHCNLCYCHCNVQGLKDPIYTLHPLAKKREKQTICHDSTRPQCSYLGLKDGRGWEDTSPVLHNLGPATLGMRDEPLEGDVDIVLFFARD